MKKLNMLAFDFGASSGRGILGQFDGEKLSIQEIHRFPNDPVEVSNHLYWDILRLYKEVQDGLLKFANGDFGQLQSIGIDTWGVDFGLLDSSGDLLGNPYHYRDSRTEGMMEEAFSRMTRGEIFSRTGIAFQKFNTLYQLLAICVKKPFVMDHAETLLFIPDLFAYFLTGEKSTEFTEATTSQLLEAGKASWSKDILKAMGIPDRIFTEIQYPGTVRGKVMPRLSRSLGIGQVPVVAVATHDTGSAVAAVPALDENFAFLSSGTWSLMGVEVDKPIINEKTLEWNYTNEGSVGGKYRLLRNIMGLWIVQECKREWERGGENYDFGELVEMAEASEPFIAFIDPDHDLFYSPGDMPRKVQEFCAGSGQRVPQTKGEILRCVFESLALKYRWSLDRLEEILQKSLDVLYIVGGGSKNKLLNQFTANAIKRPVVCGPTEATAIGNLMVQAMALGEIGNPRQIREVVRKSFPTEEYMPQNAVQWDDAYEKFLKIID